MLKWGSNENLLVLPFNDRHHREWGLGAGFGRKYMAWTHVFNPVFRGEVLERVLDDNLLPGGQPLLRGEVEVESAVPETLVVCTGPYIVS